MDALRTYNVLDTPPEAEFDDLARLAAQICDCPVAAITLVDGERQWYKARVGLDLPHTPRSANGPCSNTILGHDPLVVPDLSRDARFASSPTVEQLGLNFYAGVPLVNREEHALGTLCVLDRDARELKPHQLDALRTLGRQVVSQLELRRLALVGASRERLISILSQDVRGPLQQLLLAQMQPGSNAGHRERRLLAQVGISTERMSRLIRDVLDFTQTRTGTALKVNPRPMNLHAVCRRMVQEFALSYPGREIRLQLFGDGTGLWDEDRLAQALGNLLANALRYGNPSQPVTLTCDTNEAIAVLGVHNQGEPIPADLQSRLFEPFCRSGSSSESETSFSGLRLGLYIVREIATASGGTVEVHSNLERGTLFRMRLPRRSWHGTDVVRSALKH
ncbi:MAG: GAF domain-containing sensor histidine kinase [Myxococcaceae bacterium]